MTAPYLGGCSIDRAEWLSARSLRVWFTTTHGSDLCYQVYAGRELAGWTEYTTDRNLTANVIPNNWPQHLTLLAVTPANRQTDYGSQLPLRPYNRAKLQWSASSYPSDAEFFDVTAGTEVGGLVDAANLLARIPFGADGDYEYITDPMPGTGIWNFEIAGRDNRPGGGNLGSGEAVSADLLSHPPDVTPNADGTRFSVSVSSQQFTIDYAVAG